MCNPIAQEPTSCSHDAFEIATTDWETVHDVAPPGVDQPLREQNSAVVCSFVLGICVSCSAKHQYLFFGESAMADDELTKDDNPIAKKVDERGQKTCGDAAEEAIAVDDVSAAANNDEANEELSGGEERDSKANQQPKTSAASPNTVDVGHPNNGTQPSQSQPPGSREGGADQGASITDKEGLAMALKHFTSSTLTMRLTGITQINQYINFYIELCQTEAPG